jgi:hypothetical protein
MPDGRRYTEDDVRAILEPLRRDTAEGVAQDDLVAAAAEIGVPRDRQPASLQQRKPTS